MPVRFYLHTKTYSDGRRPIYADIRWGKGMAATSEGEARLRMGTGQSCQPANWNEEKGRIKSAERGYAKANNALIKLEHDAGHHIERAQLDEVELAPDALKALIKPSRTKVKAAADPSPTTRTMATLYADWQQARRARLSPKSLSAPQGLINRLEEFQPGITPQAFTEDKDGHCAALERFCSYLVEEAVMPRTKRVGMQNNTISSYLKLLRKLLKFARLPTDWIEDTFLEDVEREALTYAEVMQFYRHEPLELKEGSTNAGSRRQIRDVFVFNCLTGPRYSNLVDLRPSDVKLEYVDQVPVPVLEYVQHKTRRNKRKVRVSLDPVAYEIWQRYKGKLPVPTNQTLNAGIKSIARAAGLKRPVTVVRGIGSQRLESVVPLWQAISCHTARYSFVTLQYEGGNDIVSIQESVGHAGINTTRHYLKSRPTQRHVATLAAFELLRQREGGETGTPAA
jgi:integrase